MTWRSAEIESCRYGSSALWILRDELAGSGARRLAKRADLFFRSGETSLLLDLRQTGPIDSAGAGVLRACREAHSGFHTVGRPRSWAELPVGVRRTLLMLDPAPDIETALAPPRDAVADERRRHPRIGLQLPVELFTGGRAIQVTLKDLSRGGALLAMVPDDWFDGEVAGRTFGIFGLAEDPFGREICAGRSSVVMSAVAVRAPAAGQIGARFTDSPPPI